MSARDRTRNRDRAVMRALWNRPLTIRELTLDLHRAEEIPPYWQARHVGAVCRRLHRAGRLSRLSAASVTRSVLWWAS